jgi:hypothetical protein
MDVIMLMIAMIAWTNRTKTCAANIVWSWKELTPNENRLEAATSPSFLTAAAALCTLDCSFSSFLVDDLVRIRMPMVSPTDRSSQIRERQIR